MTRLEQYIPRELRGSARDALPLVEEARAFATERGMRHQALELLECAGREARAMKMQPLAEQARAAAGQYAGSGA